MSFKVPGSYVYVTVKLLCIEEIMYYSPPHHLFFPAGGYDLGENTTPMEVATHGLLTTAISSCVALCGWGAFPAWKLCCAYRRHFCPCITLKDLE
jgi:hypothetical protein